MPDHPGTPPRSTTFGHRDLPWLFRHTDDAAVSRQSETANATRTGLWLLVAGSLFAALPEWQPVGNLHVLDLTSAFLYALLLAISARSARRKAKAHWQLNRTAAEFLRGLCWEYAVQGAPFGPDTADPDGVFALRAGEEFRKLQALGWQDPRTSRAASDEKELITAAMRALRAEPFTVRREVYVRDRVTEQRDWYQRRTGQSSRSSAKWSVVAGVLTCFALLASLGRGFSLGPPVDAAGLFSTAAAACVAWMELRQFQPLVAAHSLVAQELASMTVTLRKTTSEHSWGKEVAAAEAVISPEHTAWVARHYR